MPSRRNAILDRLRTKLAQGDKALVGNSGFRRYLKTVTAESTSPSTRRGSPKTRAMTGSMCCAPTPSSLRFRSCGATATCYGSSSCSARPRPCLPLARSTTAATWPFAATCSCSFLALLLAKELEERLHRHGIAAEWGDIRRDLDRLQEIELEQDGKRFLLRTPTTGVAGKLFQAVGVALPPNFQELPLPTPQPAA